MMKLTWTYSIGGKALLVSERSVRLSFKKRFGFQETKILIIITISDLLPFHEQTMHVVRVELLWLLSQRKQ